MTKTTKGWTPERRAAARERMLKNKPWEKSTGPRTSEGKANSRCNSAKHGLNSKEYRAMLQYLTDFKKFLKAYNAAQKMLPAIPYLKRTNKNIL